MAASGPSTSAQNPPWAKVEVISADRGRLGDEAHEGGVDGVGDLFVPGDEPGQAVGAVLGLHHEVDGRVVDRGGGVGDDDDLRRPGEGHGHADLAGDLALGEGDVDVARAGDDVDRADGVGAVGHGGDGLGAADGVDLVDPGEGGGGQGGGGDPAGLAVGRNAQHDLGHAGDPGGHGGHEHRRGVGAPTAGHVAAGPVDRHRPAPHGDAAAAEGVVGPQLGLVELADGVARLGQGRDQLGRRLVERGAHLGGGHEEGLGADAVEALGVLPQGLVTPGPHVGHDRPDGGHGALASGVGSRQPGREGGAGAATEVQTVQHVARR